MARGRMIAKVIAESDDFIDMPFSAQALYFHLSINADDDGFVQNPKFIKRSIGASDNDFDELITKGFIIKFNNGVVVIRHWLLCNQIRKDRYHPTDFQSEFAMLYVGENQQYELLTTKMQPSDNQDATILQPNIIKDNLSKGNVSQDNRTKDNSIEGNRREKKDFQKGKSSKTIDEMTDEEYNALFSQAEHMPVKLG